MKEFNTQSNKKKCLKCKKNYRKLNNNAMCYFCTRENEMIKIKDVRFLDERYMIINNALERLNDLLTEFNTHLSTSIISVNDNYANGGAFNRV